MVDHYQFQNKIFNLWRLSFEERKPFLDYLINSNPYLNILFLLYKSKGIFTPYTLYFYAERLGYSYSILIRFIRRLENLGMVECYNLVQCTLSEKAVEMLRKYEMERKVSKISLLSNNLDNYTLLRLSEQAIKELCKNPFENDVYSVNIYIMKLLEHSFDNKIPYAVELSKGNRKLAAILSLYNLYLNCNRCNWHFKMKHISNNLANIGRSICNSLFLDKRRYQHSKKAFEEINGIFVEKTGKTKYKITEKGTKFSENVILQLFTSNKNF